MTSTNTLREKLYRLIFQNDTRAGNRFDVIMIWMIVLSVIFVIIESVESIDQSFHRIIKILEWVFTGLFTVEYLLRLYSARNRWKYVTSFFGIVDFISIVPSYLGLFIPGGQHLLIIRVLRLLRIFRIFQMGHFVREGAIVGNALRASRIKITVFLSFVLVVSILMGAMMYMVEADDNPNIQNIPEGIYWAIVTITTVGYGDVLPVTDLGRFLASVVMILGYGVIAVPIGIVTSEISYRVLGPRDRLKVKCTRCGDADHLQKSSYCHNCGETLNVPEEN